MKGSVITHIWMTLGEPQLILFMAEMPQSCLKIHFPIDRLCLMVISHLSQDIPTQLESQRIRRINLRAHIHLVYEVKTKIHFLVSCMYQRITVRGILAVLLSRIVVPLNLKVEETMS